MRQREKQVTKDPNLSSIKDLASLLVEIVPQDISVNLDETKRRRLEIALRARMGQSQAEICQALGCSKDTARFWMAIALEEKPSSWQHHSVGRPKTVNDEYLARLRELVTNSPRDYGYSFQRWTAKWLARHLEQELGIKISDRHVNRLLKQMGLSTRSNHQAKVPPASIPKGVIAINDLDPTDSQLQNSLWLFPKKA